MLPLKTFKTSSKAEIIAIITLWLIPGSYVSGDYNLVVINTPVALNRKTVDGGSLKHRSRVSTLIGSTYYNTSRLVVVKTAAIETKPAAAN